MPNPPGTIMPIATNDSAVHKICRFSIRRKKSIGNGRTLIKPELLRYKIGLHFCGADFSDFRDIVTQHIFNAHL